LKVNGPKKKVKENVVQFSIIRNNTSILKLTIAIIINIHQLSDKERVEGTQGKERNPIT
jgi:hypothetical protein